jgi:hypothetical protein
MSGWVGALTQVRHAPAPLFSCTPEAPLFFNVPTPTPEQPRTVVPLLLSACTATGAPAELAVPVPYTLPPVRYAPADVPWAIDRACPQPDSYGCVWPPDLA